MGVAGLLPLLRSIQKPVELKNFKGQTLGVDGYGWLHRAAFTCAPELGQGKPTDKYVHAIMFRVRMLRHFGVEPYMVFDGDYLPSKAGTEEARAKSRDQKKKLALDLMNSGKRKEAMSEFQKCIDVTPEMASVVIQQLKKMNVAYVVAPYEADAQLVYLERKGLIDGIITDDSDLLVFGAKRIFTKLDRYGNCILVNRKDFGAVREVSLTGWTDQDFRRMAILSGCDYLDGLPGVGLKTAYRLLRKSKTPERVVKGLQFQGTRVSENYLTRFYQAELTFLHQWVFCPEKRELVHLTELDGRTAEEMPYIGAHVDVEIARAVAKGNMDPITKTPFQHPVTPNKRRHSQMHTPKAKEATPTPAKSINSYFKSSNRIPMGAMDPNCFSVDAQRVAELTDGGLVPRVFPLPRPYLQEATEPLRPSSQVGKSATRTSPRLQRRRTEPISNLLSQTGSTPTSRKKIGAASSSSPAPTPKTEPQIRPQKKARLCDDTQEDESPKQSKFFSAKKPAASPRRSSVDDFLKSDDSIAEALLNMPDMDGFHSPVKNRKSISVFSEPKSPEKVDKGEDQGISQVTSQESSTQEVSQETTATSFSEVTFSQHAADPDETSLSPSKTMPPPKFTSRFANITKTPAMSKLSRFSHSPSSSSATPSSVATSARSSASVFSAASTPSTAASSISRPTPLQRLGARALNAPVSPKPRQTSFTKPGKFLSGLPLNPSSVPLPKVDLKEVEALNGPTGGSEDQIIPDSDGEDGGEEEWEAAPATKLDLSRFAFSKT